MSSLKEQTKCVYCGLQLCRNSFYAAFFDGKNILAVERYQTKSEITDKAILDWFKAYARENNIKIAAIGVEKNKELKALAAAFWLKLDIVPCFLKLAKNTDRNCAVNAALGAKRDFNGHNLAKIKISKDNQINVSWLMRLKDYEKIVPIEQFTKLIDLVQEFQTRKASLLFINSTPRGGGVALMRHALIRLFRLLNVSAHWHIVNGNNEVFAITKKKFHNILQGVSAKTEKITLKDIRFYNKWIETNARKLKPVIKKATIVVIDDPQPCGLIPYIKKWNPDAKIIYRSHIHIDAKSIGEKNSQPARNWQFLWNNIKHADLFAAHPVSHFIPHTVPSKKVVFMPATSDRLDGLNKPLSKEQMSFYLGRFNKILKQNDQLPLDLKRPYIIQIARFDPSKGIPDVIESYRRLRDKLDKDKMPFNKIPQLVLVGHGAIDDPEGKPIYEEIAFTLGMDSYAGFAADIKIARIYPSDQILNALLRAAKIALQLSHKEGFEIKITEALRMGIPVIAYSAGGIPLQIQHKASGYLVEIGNTHKVAEYMRKLIINEKYYREMSENAQKQAKDFSTVKNAINWLYLANGLLGDKKLGNEMNIDENA